MEKNLNLSFLKHMELEKELDNIQLCHWISDQFFLTQKRAAEFSSHQSSSRKSKSVTYPMKYLFKFYCRILYNTRV